MSTRKLFAALLLAAAAVAGPPVADAPAGPRVHAANPTWHVEVMLYRHGQWGKYTLPANYSSRENAQKGYQAWLKTLEPKAKGKLVRIFTQ